jgi:hypothetical protein
VRSSASLTSSRFARAYFLPRGCLCPALPWWPLIGPSDRGFSHRTNRRDATPAYGPAYTSRYRPVASARYDWQQVRSCARDGSCIRAHQRDGEVPSWVPSGSRRAGQPTAAHVRRRPPRAGTGQPPDRAAITATIAASLSRELVRRLHTERREQSPARGNCVSPISPPKRRLAGTQDHQAAPLRACRVCAPRNAPKRLVQRRAHA